MAESIFLMVRLAKEYFNTCKKLDKHKQELHIVDSISLINIELGQAL